MSSFSNPHYMYLFEMKNGKKKLAYGQPPEDALDVLASPLCADEMALMNREQYIKIKQRELQQHVDGKRNDAAADARVHWLGLEWWCDT